MRPKKGNRAEQITEQSAPRRRAGQKAQSVWCGWGIHNLVVRLERLFTFAGKQKRTLAFFAFLFEFGDGKKKKKKKKKPDERCVPEML